MNLSIQSLLLRLLCPSQLSCKDAVKTQKKVLSRADAERRLISQEARLKESERRMKEK